MGPAHVAGCRECRHSGISGAPCRSDGHHQPRFRRDQRCQRSCQPACARSGHLLVRADSSESDGDSCPHQPLPLDSCDQSVSQNGPIRTHRGGCSTSRISGSCCRQRITRCITPIHSRSSTCITTDRLVERAVDAPALLSPSGSDDYVPDRSCSTCRRADPPQRSRGLASAQRSRRSAWPVDNREHLARVRTAVSPCASTLMRRGSRVGDRPQVRVRPGPSNG